MAYVLGGSCDVVEEIIGNNCSVSYFHGIYSSAILPTGVIFVGAFFMAGESHSRQTNPGCI